METYTGQQLLVPPESAVERTLRTGNIDMLGVHFYSTPDIVSVFDDVIERPEHYYDEAKNLMPAASRLGKLMVDSALRVLGEGTISDIEEKREALFPGVMRHLGYSFDPHGSSLAISDDTMYDMQKGMEQQRAAYELLMDAPKVPGSGYELNVLRSHNGLAAKALCMIVDAPDQVMMFQQLDTHFPDSGKLRFLLRGLVDLQVIRIDRFKYDDEDPTNIAYATYPDSGPYCRTSEDSELMVLARHHAKRYDEAQQSAQKAPAAES